MATYTEYKEYPMNTTFEELNVKFGTDIDIPSLAKTQSALELALSSLEKQIDYAVSSLEVGDTWDDEISANVSNESVSGIDKIIDKCKNPSFEILTAIGASAEPLVTDLDLYVKEVKKYNEEIFPKWQTAKKNEPKRSSYHDDDEKNKGQPGWQSGDEKYNTAHSEWEKFSLKPTAEACEAVQNSCTELEEKTQLELDDLKELMKPVGTEGSNKALIKFRTNAPKPEGIPKDAEVSINEEGYVTYTYEKEDGTTVSTSYDSAQHKVQEVSVKTGTNGDVSTITVRYNADGRVESKTVEEVHKEGAVTTTTTRIIDPTNDDHVLETVEKVENTEDHTVTTTTINEAGLEVKKETVTYKEDGSEESTQVVENTYGGEDGKTKLSEVITEYGPEGTSGKPTSQSTVTYGDNGKPAKQETVTYGPDGAPSGTEVVEYKYTSDGLTPTSQVTTEYGPEGTSGKPAKQETVTYGPNGEPSGTEVIKYKYGTDGSTLTSQVATEYGSEGHPTSQTIVTYGDNGEPTGTQVTEYSYSQDGSAGTTTITHYGPNGTAGTPTSQTVQTYTGGTTPASTETTTYRENGLPKQITVTDNTSQTTSVSTIDEYGNMITHTTSRDGSTGETTGQHEETRLAALNAAMNDGQIDDAEREGLGLFADTEAEISQPKLMAAASREAQDLDARLNQPESTGGSGSHAGGGGGGPRTNTVAIE